MNTDYPHDILPEQMVCRLDPETRRRFVPIPESAAEMLAKKTPEERAQWLAEHPIDALRIQRAQEKRDERAAQIKRLQDEINSTRGTLAQALRTTP